MLGSYALPLAAFADGALPVSMIEGQVTRAAYQFTAVGISTLAVTATLRAQLSAFGFEVLLDCDSPACGGFDFRFATEVLPPPAMHVDLGDFRFLSARRSGPDAEAISILVSRAAGVGFVQIIRVGPPDAVPLTLAGSQAAIAAPMPDAGLGDGQGAAAGTVPIGSFDLGQRLETEGRVVLSDLSFPTGSAQLAAGEFVSLVALADYLRDNPSRRVALVGHTDSEGSLDGNITLSRRRAGSVLERLAADHGVPRSQMEAEGMGYLAPIASNLTPEGRQANRRVEVILISTEPAPN